MTLTSRPPLTAVLAEQQAQAWLRRIASGRMTTADGQALLRWCRADPLHAQAMGEARRQWAQLKEAGALSLARQPAWTPAGSAASVIAVPQPWQRRAFLGTAFGMSAAAAVAVVVAPPLGLWPSLGELRADLRTGTGEQRRVALDDAVSLQLNTRTSVAVWPASRGAAGIDLVAGEAAVDIAQGRGTGTAFSVRAGAVNTLAFQARFDVRRQAGGGCVTCLQGQVRVEHATASVLLNAQQQLAYTDAGLGRVVAVDGAQVSAWREGFLRFIDTPLGEVVDEINRYRAGRVVLVGERLATRAVTGRFQIHALDKAIAQIQHSLHLQVRSLPGGVVLLS